MALRLVQKHPDGTPTPSFWGRWMASRARPGHQQYRHFVRWEAPEKRALSGYSLGYLAVCRQLAIEANEDFVDELEPCSLCRRELARLGYRNASTA